MNGWTEAWLPRSQCGPWTDELIWIYVSGHLAVVAAYFAIPVVLIVISRSSEFRLVITDYSFAVFIFACGVGHLLDASSVWWVNYQIHAASVWVTAIASWAAVGALPSLLFRRRV